MGEEKAGLHFINPGITSANNKEMQTPEPRGSPLHNPSCREPGLLPAEQRNKSCTTKGQSCGQYQRDAEAPGHFISLTTSSDLRF